MIELSPDTFDKTRSVFEGIELYTPLPYCVIERNQPGRIFADNVANPRAALVCQQSGYYYAGGDSEEFADALEGRLFSEIGLDRFELSVTPGFWEARMKTFMGDRSAPYQMYSYRLNENTFRQNSARLARLPSGCRLERIEESHVNLVTQNPRMGILAFWNSLKEFVDKGLGICLFEGEELASWCLTSFVGDGKCDVSLQSVEKFRRRGYATLATAAFVESCIEDGLTPVWHTTVGNAASDNIAQRMGFELIGEFTMYSIERESVE